MNETAQGQFEAVHVCLGCGTAIERKEVNPESLISGLIACPHCGHESPLNLEIRGKGEKRPPARENSLTR
jgi:DNA-directed RNA polymerase subunit RPC12/RpoP